LAEDKKNTLVFIGYQAEGTMGSRIQKGWREYTYTDNNGEKKMIKIEADVETVEGFSGHSDRNQLINYVAKLRSRPDRIFLNHGEHSKSVNLAATLHRSFKIETSVPSNLDAVRLK
ncbi:MAG: MBL fold metallo-hydrolase RNA specificity domain-containing protein, partial [archaeon]